MSHTFIKLLFMPDVRQRRIVPSTLASKMTTRRALAGALALLTLQVVPYAGAAQNGAAAVPIKAIGVENEYADVISQIGGKYVRVTAIETDPNTDPHSFEVNTKIAASIVSTDLIVKNGVGYDTWADQIIAAALNATRKVIDVQHLLALSDTISNPHLWYDPKTMPLVAKKIAADLSELAPAHAAYFKANLAKFDASLQPWFDALASFKSEHGETPIAVTEPVGDYMLQAAGAKIETPFNLEASVMNGTDPAPQDVTVQNELFTSHKVKAFLYNQQVTDSFTQSFLALAKKNGEPRRILRRLQSLREWSYEQKIEVFPGSPRTGCASGARAAWWAFVDVGGRRVDRAHDRLFQRDSARVGAT